MKEQFENKVMSSLLLYLDHKVSSKGDAYTNHSSNFYSTDHLYNGYYTYAAPFKQLVGDNSVTGATVWSGLYLNSTQVDIGTSGLHSVNHYEGQAYFSSQLAAGTAISGDYSIKDFNIYLTSKSEQELIFETKFEVRPRVTQTVTGLAPNVQTYPAIFLKNNGGKNDPFAFGGLDSTILNVRCIVLADSAYSNDAVCGILKDLVRTNMPIVEKSELPFNALGATTSTSGFNYSGVTQDKTSGGDVAWVKDVTVSKNVGNFYKNDLNPNVFTSFVDFSLESIRLPRG